MKIHRLTAKAIYDAFLELTEGENKICGKDFELVSHYVCK